MNILQVFLSIAFTLVLLVESSEQEDIVKNSTYSVTTETIPIDNSIDSIVQKWKEADKAAKKYSSDLVKIILPIAVNSFGGLNLSTSCSRSLLKFLTGVKQFKLWAVKMLDSSGKIPNGMFRGSVVSLGDYDECIETDVPGHFQGQYCLLEVNPPLPKRRPFVSAESWIPEFENISDPQSTMWEILKYGNFMYTFKSRTSVCVPSTCKAEEVERIAEKVLEHIGIAFDVTIPSCEIKENNKAFSNSEIFVMIILCLILCLALAATITDVWLRLHWKKTQEQVMTNTGHLTKCLLCFSFYTNTMRLLRKDDSKDSIKIFHGMKVITILWVMLSHNYSFTNQQVFSMGFNAREFGMQRAFQVVLNGFLSVETFFFITAVLIAYGVMKMKETKLNVFLFVFHRLWRLTPPFMFVIATAIFIPRIGSGPVWNETVVKFLSEKCTENWWTNLLYFHNFIPTAEMCLPWTWYIAVDTHMYFLSLLVIIPLKRNLKLAFLMNGAILIFGIGATAITNVYFNFPPTMIYVYHDLKDIRYYLERAYLRTYIHLSTYCVGLTVGYLLATKKNVHIPLRFNLIGWIASFSIALTLVYGVYDWNQGNIPSILISTLYTCTNKLVWSLALGWVTFSCFTGNAGIITSILSWQAFVPFARLTYMAYLLHPIIQVVYIGSTRTELEASHRFFVYKYFGDIVLAFMCAYFFSLLFESPFMALEKVLLLGGRNSTMKTIPVENTPDQDVFQKDKEITSSNQYELNGKICTININT